MATSSLLMQGKPKGIQHILEERGLVTVVRDPLKTAVKVFNHAGAHIVGQCKQCKDEKAQKPAPDTNANAAQVNDIASESEEDDDCRTECCMSRMLSQQANFKGQKLMLEQVSIVISFPHLLTLNIPGYH